ncbi:MAG: DUF3999 family protein, partial [Maribacter sp.]
MTLKTKTTTLFLTLFALIGHGQMDTYNKKMQLNGIDAPWHQIYLPDAVFEEVKADFSDIRIYGITASDTIEAPFLVSNSKGIDSRTTIPFELLNTVSNAEGYFYTYRLSEAVPVNEIKLDFQNSNFDWRIHLEGSQNQQDWFTLLTDYRILSIENDLTAYAFTDLKFPDAQYQYFRVMVIAREKPILRSATVTRKARQATAYRPVEIYSFKTSEEDKNTIIDITATRRNSVSRIKLDIAADFEYYRPVKIQYLSDSLQTEKGMQYRYTTLTTGTLSSLEPNNFELPNTLAKQFQVVISNHDNRPLTVSNVALEGYLHTLTARFTESATYFLVFGNPDAYRPNYDISKTPITLPDSLSTLSLGPLQT